MPSESSNAAERTFRQLFSEALVHGRRPPHTSLLGPASWAAIDVLAREHPDASPDQVIAAHDAFALEHEGDAARGELAATADPATARAVEYAAIDTLVAQLAITYPDVDHQTLAAVVRRTYAEFDDHELREFVPLFVEQAVHQQLA